MDDKRIIVVTEQPYFDDPAARHIVEVADGEIETEWLFFRDARKGQKARRLDASGNGPGRCFCREPLCGRVHAVRDDVPERRHASFADFLRAIGYDWRSNSYRQAAIAA